MARLLPRIRSRRAEGAGAEEPVRLPPPPPAGVLRRERRALLRIREQRIRDLGGLMLEMYRRDVFRDDLLRDQCEELVALEARLEELDWLLTSPRQPPPAPLCACGTPLLPGARFCSGCGRSAVGAGTGCAACGSPLAPEAQFCGNCGRATGG